MNKIKIEVTGAQAVLTQSCLLTGGMVGVSVEFTFDGVWDGLMKTGVFRAGGRTVSYPYMEDETQIPWEVLNKSGCTLYIGVCGCNEDGSVVIPTVWVAAGTIQPGADPEADPGMDPALPVWKQNEDIARQAVEIAESVRADADAGVFAGPQGEQGEPGKTPVRGVDYWTAADRTQILQELETSVVGDMDNALDYILSIQNKLTGGSL